MPVEDQGLLRFVNAQDCGDPASLETALRELRAGKKQEHWIWYVFPQLRGLGYSRHAKYYGIKGLSEAIEYLHDPVLRGRYRLCLSELLFHLRNGSQLQMILGSTDALKTISSITLFQYAAKQSGLHDQQSAAELLSLMQEFLELVSPLDGCSPCQKTLQVLE